MTVLGTVYLNGCNYQIGYDLVSQSTANNTSTVKFYGVLNVTNNYVSWSSGSASVRGVSTGIGTYYSKGSYTLVQTQTTITHNADGTYSATVSGSLSTTFVSGTASGKITLPTIARASQPSINTWPDNSPNFNIGDTITIHMNRKSSSFTHKVVFKLNSYSYVIAASGVTNNVIFNTSTIADNIYAQIPNSTVANGTIEVTTYNGSTTIGTKSCSFSAHTVGVNPTFNAAYLDTNSTTTTITGNNQKIIQAKSTLQINATSLSAKKSATLSSIKAVINGTTYNATISGTSATFNIGTLNLSSNVTATLTLTDSRGLTATKSLTIQMLAWALPTAIITANRENNFYNPTTINVDANYSSLDGNNTIIIQMRHKKTTDTSYSSYQTLQDNVPVTLQLDNNYQWNVQVVLTDRLGTKTYNTVVERGIPIIFFDKNKRSIGINRFPINEETLEVNGNIIVANNDGSHPCYLKTQYVTTTGTNLNDYVDQGIYFFNANYIPTNIPTGVNGWLVVMALGELDNSDKFVKQLWLRAGTPNTNDYDMYVRTRSWDGNWGSWRKIITQVDTSWKTITLNNLFTYYDNNSNTPKYKKIGNIVMLAGIITPTQTLDSSTERLIGNLPEGYRPVHEVRVICQGSGMNRWLLSIFANGNIMFQRYGTTAMSNVSAGNWLPFNTTFFTE